MNISETKFVHESKFSQAGVGSEVGGAGVGESVGDSVGIGVWDAVAVGPAEKTKGNAPLVQIRKLGSGPNDQRPIHAEQVQTVQTAKAPSAKQSPQS